MEFNRIELNRALTNNHGFHTCFMKFTNKNNFQFDIKVNERKLFNNNYIGNTSEKLIPKSNKKFRLFEKLSKSKLKFNITKKLIYSLSIFGFVFIVGFILFLIS